MIRTFHSVGQGAFYTEDFGDFTMVYDCGGNTKKIIEGEIKGTFDSDKKIEALFISHFHNDHINGLKFLLGYCKVEKIYLPLLTKNAEIQLLIENRVYGKRDTFIDGLIQDPVNTVRQNSENSNIRVIFVRAENQDIDSNRQNDNATIIPSGQEIQVDEKEEWCEWVFVPYNFQYATLNAALVGELKKDGINIGDIENELKTKEKTIIKTYKKVLGDTKNFNVNSLVVYSGPRDKEWHSYTNGIYVNHMPYLCNYRHGRESGCLYLGDHNVSDQLMMDNLKLVYKDYWDLLCTVQMPHHGSKYNYHSDLVRANTYAIMSAGRKNRYRHPHAVTVREILMKRAIPIIVTEEVDTKAIQEVIV